MYKKRWRQMCYNSLVAAGYKNPQLYFERNRKEYSSYWGSDLQRAEVFLNKQTGTVQIFELQFVV